MAEAKKYTIADKTFTQKPLVPIKIIKLIDLLESLKLGDIDFSTVKAIDVVKIFGRNISDFLMIIIEHEDNLDESLLKDFLDNNATLPTILEVVDDFFDINGVFAILKLATTMRPKAQAPIADSKK